MNVELVLTSASTEFTKRMNADQLSFILKAVYMVAMDAVIFVRQLLSNMLAISLKKKVIMARAVAAKQVAVVDTIRGVV